MVKEVPFLWIDEMMQLCRRTASSLSAEGCSPDEPSLRKVPEMHSDVLKDGESSIPGLFGQVAASCSSSQAMKGSPEALRHAFRRCHSASPWALLSWPRQEKDPRPVSSICKGLALEDYEKGVVLKHWDQCNAYRILLASGDQVHAPMDLDSFVMRAH